MIIRIKVHYNIFSNYMWYYLESAKIPQVTKYHEPKSNLILYSLLEQSDLSPQHGGKHLNSLL